MVEAEPRTGFFELWFVMGRVKGLGACRRRRRVAERERQFGLGICVGRG